ncbi:hypothetical protein QUC31_002351 [Theobroma cacao]
MVKAGTGLKELPSKQEWANDIEKASFMNNCIPEIPPDLSPNCETLSTLLLQNNGFLHKIAESFFQHMHRLNILDLSNSDIEQLPNSVSNLEKLKALVLHGCENLRYVPSLEKLKALRKLDLGSTAIEEVPTGLEMLADLIYLNLKTESLKELPSGVLSKLTSLQCLVFDVESSTLKINGSDAARLRKLKTFEARFNDLIDFNLYSKSIQGQRLTSYLLVMAPLEAKFDVRPLEVGPDVVIKLKVNMSKLAHHEELVKIMPNIKGAISLSLYGTEGRGTWGRLEVVGAVKRTTIVEILEKNFGELVVKSLQPKLPDSMPKKDVILSGCQVGSEDPVVLPSDLWRLSIFECHNLRSLSDISLFQQTNELRFCLIHDCKGMESVLDFSSSSSSPCTAFENLELLWLEKLDNLRMLVKVGDVSTSSTALPLLGIFSHLKSIRIEGCSNMKQLFPFEFGHDLQNLEYLEVGHCGKMEEIIASEEEEENHKGKGTHSPMMFSLPKLRELKLKKLPKLKSICSSNTAMKCDSLRVIEVRKCPNLKRMPLHLPVFQDTDPSSSHSSCIIRVYPKEWWKSVEWDFPSAKNILQPRFVGKGMK